jgi:hypothetical protein
MKLYDNEDKPRWIVWKYSDHIENEVSIDCTCGCCRVNVLKYDWDDEDYPENVSISFTNNYLAENTNRFQRAWRELMGKRVYHAEACCTTEDAIKFLEDALKMLKGYDDFEEDSNII